MSMHKFFSQASKTALDQGLAKTKQSFWHQLGKAIAGKAKVDEAVLDELEEMLIGADVGIDTTVKIIERLEQRVARDKYLSTAELDQLLKEEMMALFPTPAPKQVLSSAGPHVVLVVGVNGVGKTTTIGKLAAQYQQAGKQVILGAADTFRAAAVEQLQQWGDRVGATVIAKGQHTDPAAVAHETIQEGLRRQADVILIDTAGRLHTKVNLMQELAKIRRTIQKLLPEAPQEVLLVLDGSTGQNAFVQAEAFTQATAVTALAITKLDGTARGGVVLGIADQFQVPVKYIGVGEGVDDLQLFDPPAFVAALLGT
ncbi:MAG: signal recognition particle-docking protein FtsY [Bacteroidota bacterium]